ncbi:methyltransferase family protein [Mycobacterium asiaticum]|uniref:Isoprenylcysteine carboxyl methyltransferase n=1 Tax=Mycobacterium asiaticum TaxID=1790 RepID=A0A1A3NCA2_MYCAS|nr:isoprenylcysteine carboxylmethyltransferase family protein [Mycobacterium asiaticum]OBK19406.1 isoprenylcysteine carboxyl methyltransferase [Mycobacterium asiaticum]
MPHYFAALLVVLLMGTVLGRVLLLKRSGIRAMHFGRLDKSDFAIPPVALFYFYTIFAVAFGWPVLTSERFFHSAAVAWIGVACCAIAIVILVLSLVSFGRSFRVGIDVDRPGGLVTSGIFAVSRNPIYVAFFLFMVGQLLVFPNWVPLVYLFAATWLFHRQVLREEDFMRQHYGQQFVDYCRRVRRYV